VAQTDTERFWDARARENALFFVDNRLAYRSHEAEGFWAGGEAALEELLAAAGVRVGPADAVVDIGCGVGRLTRALAGRARTVIAVDVSAEMLARAAELNPRLGNVRWLHGDGRGLAGIADASVDACVSHVVFQHIADPAVTLGYVAEMGRVLRPGGWAAFQVSTDPAIHRAPGPVRRLRWRVAALLRRGPRAQEHPAWLGSAVALQDLERVAASSGLTLERVIGAGSQFTTVLARRGPAAPSR
jgi:SAM-dependent methyltransferase